MFRPWQAVLFLIVFVALVGGAFYWYYMPSGTNSADMNAQPTAQTTGDQATATTQQAPVDTVTASISASGSSDASLDTDLNAVDAQLKAVNADSAAVDQSLNDKPVAQTE